MKGTSSALSLFEQYPLLWVPVGALMLGAMLGPPLLRTIRSRRTRAAALHQRLAAIDKARHRLLASEGPEHYYAEAQAWLHSLDPKKELPGRDDLDRLIETAHLSDTIFHYNSVDWFAAHATQAEYDRLIAGLRALGLRELIAPVEAAADYRYRIDHDLSDADFEVLEALSDGIQADYDRRGGAARVRDAVYARLRPQIDALLAT